MLYQVNIKAYPIHISLCSDISAYISDWRSATHTNWNLTLIAWKHAIAKGVNMLDNQLRPLWYKLTSLHRVKWIRKRENKIILTHLKWFTFKLVTFPFEYMVVTLFSWQFHIDCTWHKHWAYRKTNITTLYTNNSLLLVDVMMMYEKFISDQTLK